MTTQKASVAKMSLLIFITEPKSWGFSPIQLNLVFEKALFRLGTFLFGLCF
jgi:hypothetical protein